MHDADVLLIGTSPPMLFEGLARARAGQNVLFADQATIMGGSWRCPQVMGFEGVEVGVHLIENRPHLNKMFEALLAPDERIISAPDFGLWRGRRLPMQNARILLYGGIAGRNALKGNWERVSHSLGHMRAALRHRNLPFIYPKAGMVHVLKQLESRLRSFGAKFLYDHPIKRITITKDGVEALSDQGNLWSGHLVMSSRAHAPLTGFEPHWQRIGTETVTSMVLKTQGPAPLFDGYVEIINDPNLKRVRNVTAFAKPEPKGDEALLSAQLRKPLAGNSSDAIKAHMVALGLLEPQTNSLETHVDRVCLNTLPHRSIVEIEENYPDQITILRTVDLGDSTYDSRIFDAGTVTHSA